MLTTILQKNSLGDFQDVFHGVFDALSGSLFGLDDYSDGQVSDPLAYLEKYEKQLNYGLLHISYDENDNEHIFSLYVPGFKKDDITIKVKSDSKGIEMLYVTGNKVKNSDSANTSNQFKFVEYLPESYKNITSTLEDGILKIIIVKDKEVEKPVKERKIEIG